MLSKMRVPWACHMCMFFIDKCIQSHCLLLGACCSGNLQNVYLIVVDVDCIGNPDTHVSVWVRGVRETSLDAIGLFGLVFSFLSEGG